MDHQILALVKWRNVSFMYKQLLGVEMFKVTKENFTHRLSQTSELVNSRRGKLVFRLRAKTAFGKQSLLFY